MGIKSVLPLVETTWLSIIVFDINSEIVSYPLQIEEDILKRQQLCIIVTFWNK